MGIYDGKIAEDKIRDYVDNSDLILNIGAKLTDSATAGFHTNSISMMSLC